MKYKGLHPNSINEVSQSVVGIYAGGEQIALFSTGSTTFNNPVSASIFSGSFYGDGSNLTGVSASSAISASYALTASYALSTDAIAFPYTGNAVITGSLTVTNQVSASLFSGSFYGDGSNLTGITQGNRVFTQAVPAATWTFNHAIGSNYPVVTVYNDSDEVVTPSKILNVDSDTIQVEFGSPVAGYLVIGYGDKVTVSGSTVKQDFNTPAVSWSFVHNLGSQYVQVQVFDSNDQQIIPASLTLTNISSSIITFASASTGYALATIGGEPIDGFFDTLSGSLSSRITDLETFSSSLSTTENIYSGSFSGSFEGDGSGITGVVSASHAITASYALNAGAGAGFPYSGSAVITGSLLVTGTITAQEFHTEFVSASIIYQSGSTKFGDTLDDTHDITGSVGITGSLDVDLRTTTKILSASYIDLDVLANGDIPEHKAGRLYFGAEDGALSVYNEEADITLQVGQEFYVRAYNGTATTIPNGTPVRVSGSQGDRVRIFPALAADHSTGPNFESHILGVATHAIESGSEGYVTAQGVVRGVDTSAFSAGDILFLQTGSAGFRNDPPPFPYDAVQVGYVAKSASPNGFIFVEPKEPVHFSNISGLSGSYQADVGDLWVFQSNNAWTHTRTLSGSYTVDNGGITANFFTGSLEGTASYASDANLLDGIDSSQFLRSDISDSLTGNLTITGSLITSGSVVDFTDATAISGSIFSGSFRGDGSLLTGLATGNRIFYQATPSVSWSFVHGQSGERPVITVYDLTNNVIMPSTLRATDADTVEATFAAPQAGYLTVGFGNQLSGSSVYEQFTTSTSWSFEHNLGSRFVTIQAFDEGYNQIIPTNIELSSVSSSLLTFSSASAGFAVATLGGNGNVPANPASGTYFLRSDNGTNSWSQVLTGSFSGSFHAQDHIIPSVTDLYDLGSPSNRFRDIYLSGSTIYLGDIQLKEQEGGLTVVDGSGNQKPFSGSFTGSILATEVTASGVRVDGDLKVTGTVTAQEFHTEFVSASIVYQSGSTKFGDTSDDVMSITGSIHQSGSDSYFLGNVGVGTTSPDNKLMVQGASTNGAGSTGNLALFEGPSGTNGLKIFVDDAENASGLQTISSDDLLLNPHGGNVGIGTASPSFSLDVRSSELQVIRISRSGTAGSTAGAGILFEAREPTIGTGQTALLDSILGGLRFRVGGTSGDTSGGSEAMRIDSSGRLVFNPASISDNNNSIFANSNGYMYMEGGTNGLILANNSGSDCRIRIEDGNSIQFQTSSGERMRIDSSGNVGIGTTSPDAPLNVSYSNNTRDDTLRLTNRNAVGYGPWINFYGDYNGGYSFAKIGAENQSTGASLRFHTADTSGVSQQRMIIDNAGNVGIGTASPGVKLEVNGNIKLSSTAGATATPSYIWLGNDYSNGTTRDKLKIYLYNSGTEQYGFSVGSVGDVQYHSNGFHDFYVSNSNKLRITSAGNVGIGTTSPASLANYTFLTTNNATAGGGIVMQQGGTNKTAVYNAGNSLFYDSTSHHYFRTGDALGGDTKMYIDSSGKVGIGTDSPSANGLHIEKTGNHLFLRASTATAGKYWNFDVTSANQLYIINNGGTGMTILDNGNVGIGTTSPLARMDVSSTGTASPTVAALTIRDTTTSDNYSLPPIYFSHSGDRVRASIQAVNNGPYGAKAIKFSTYEPTAWTDTANKLQTRMFISDNGDVYIGSTSDTGTGYHRLAENGFVRHTRDGNIVMTLNRTANDGNIVVFEQDGSTEGTISVSGTTVSYNGGHLARWSQLPDSLKDESIVKGTVMTNLDEMCEWTHSEEYWTEEDELPVDEEGNPTVAIGDIKKEAFTEDNEQLNRMKVSDVEGDTNVAGVFVNWDNSDDFNDMNIAMTGDMVIRIAKDVTVQRGDLLMSAGDGTAKPQGDDLVRSKTIAKVTSTHVSHTYDDGSYLVPCVLMAC